VREIAAVEVFAIGLISVASLAVSVGGRTGLGEETGACGVMI